MPGHADDFKVTAQTRRERKALPEAAGAKGNPDFKKAAAAKLSPRQPGSALSGH